MQSSIRSRLVPFVAAALLMVAAVRPADAEGWKAGAAKVNITPDEFMAMSGYGNRDRPAEAKLTDLWAKALALEDGAGHRAVLVTMDLIGIDRGLAAAVCRDLKRQYGLRRHQIALCTSHTHTGPVVAQNLRPMHYLLLDARQQQLVDEYAAVLQRKIVSVVGSALERLAPSRLAWGSGTAALAVNRRNNPERDVPQLREQGKLAGPVDHDVPVLAVIGAGEKLTAVVFGYACHATVLSFYQWSGDYPGFAQLELERSHPDAVALFWAGCGGDQNPLPRRKVELAQSYGRQLARAVDDVLAKEMSPLGDELATSYREIALPLGRLPTRGEIEQETHSDNKFVVARAKWLLAEIDAGRPPSQTYPYPVALWRLGDRVQWVLLGGEVVVDYALRLKSELQGTATWVAGYTNDVMAYIPSRRVLQEGGYEGAGAMIYYGLPTVWAPEVEDMIVHEVHRQVSGAK